MTKYNARKTVIDNIQFDSKAEGQYYLHLKEKQQRGEILAFKLQPRFMLQEAFKKDGKTFRAIEYIADFEIIHPDESIEIVDVKGMITPDFAIKRKLFEKRYPYKLSLMKYVKKFGGWVDSDRYKELKKIEQKTGFGKKK